MSAKKAPQGKKPASKPGLKKPPAPVKKPKPTPAPVKKPKPTPAPVKKPKPTPAPVKPAPKPASTPKVLPIIGSLRYILTPEAETSPVRDAIVAGMDAAIDTYNRNAPFEGCIEVHYDSSVGTAEACGQRITFGGMVGYRVSLHEIAHVMGIGTTGAWWNPACRNTEEMMWIGKRATDLVREYTGSPELHADNLHFWPFGLNWDTDLTPYADTRHVRVVYAMVQDMRECS
jgi:hypothetical protein